MASIRASEEGIKRFKQARKRKGWTATAPYLVRNRPNYTSNFEAV
jgi:hypothetical protein